MTTFDFVEELPALRQNNHTGGRPEKVLLDFADALRAHPQQWATYPKPIKCPAPAAWRINNQLEVSLGTGEFEARTRGGVLYVRYIGESA